MAWFSGQALDRFLALILVALIARYEGVAGLGRYALVLSIVGISERLADFGLNTLLTREAARVDNRERQRLLLGHILVLKSGLAGGVYLGLLLIVPLLPWPAATRQLILVGSILLPARAVTGAIEALINARQRMEVTGALQLTERLAMVAGSILLLVRGDGVAGVIAYSVGIGLLSVPLYLAWLGRWKLLPRFQKDFTAWLLYLKEAYPFGLTMGLAALYTRLDLVLISLWHGEIVAGWYGAAYKLWESLNLVPSSMLFALFPEMSRLSTIQAGIVRLRTLFRLGQRMMPVGGVLLAAGATVWAGDLVRLVYGQMANPVPTTVSLQILVWAFPAVFMAMLCGRVLYALGQQRQVLWIMVGVALFNVLLNLIVIPRWGYQGASAVALGSEFLMLGLTYVKARRALDPTPPLPTTLSTGGYVSAQVTVVDLDGDGQPEIIAASDALHAWRLNGNLLPGFPVRGSNFFASRPVVGDFDGDGCPEILVGCDDDALYVFDTTANPLPGWPCPTGGDIYSSPALVDLDGDGRLEVIVGSDDGCIYVWRADGSSPGGWPQSTQGFVSASPTLADLAGDGRSEIIIGSWDGQLYVWRSDGTRLPGWPQPTNHFIWSTAAVGDLDGDGSLEVVVASDKVYAWRANGRTLPGWPQATESYAVGSPALADLDGDGRLELILGSDQLYAWRHDGRLLPGFPVDLDTYLWSSPTVGDVDGDGQPEIVIGGWNGQLYVVGVDGNLRVSYATRSPIFATPSLADLDKDERLEIIIGAWDRNVYIFRDRPHAPWKSILFPWRVCKSVSPAPMLPAGQFTHVPEFTVPFVTFPGFTSRRAVLYYRAHFETDWHPVPLVVHQGSLTGLIQPFLSGTRVQYYAEVWQEGDRWQRIPSEGTFGYTIHVDWTARLHRICSSCPTAPVNWLGFARLG